MDINYEVAFNLLSKVNEEDKAKIKQLEEAINKVFAFRISTSFVENVNELSILQNELKRALEDK